MITEQEREAIIEFCNKYEIIDYTIHENGVVDVDNTVDLGKKKLKAIPIQFGIVNGSFLISDNKLKSLKGCPKIVKGGFDCGENKLTNLIGGPEEVSGRYWCDDNELDTLYGLPKIIHGALKCEHNFVDDEILDYLQESPLPVVNKFLSFLPYYDVFTETDFNLDEFHGLLEDIEDGLE